MLIVSVDIGIVNVDITDLDSAVPRDYFTQGVQNEGFVPVDLMDSFGGDANDLWFFSPWTR